MNERETILNRLSEIETLLRGDEMPDNLDALEREVSELQKRLGELDDQVQRRNALKAQVAGGAGMTVRKFAPGGSVAQKSFGVDSPEYRSAWLKNLQGKELTAQERAAVTASAAIPTETMNMIVHRLELAPLISAVDVTYIPGNVTFPVADTVNPASWVAMDAASTDSADTLKSITLAAYKLIKTVEITADIKAMAIPAFESWIVSSLANQIEAAVDLAILTGDGSSKATGILHTGEVTNTGTWTAGGMTYSDLLSIIAKLPTKYHPGAKFVTTREVFYGQILGMKTDGGDKVVVADVQNPAKFNVLGYPVIVDDNCKADTVIFGDLKQYKFNFAAPVEVTSDASVGFRSGSTVYRAMCLADGKVADKNAFTVFTKAGG